MGLRDLEMTYRLFILKSLTFMMADSVKALTSLKQMYCLLTDSWPLGWLEEVSVLMHYIDLKTIVLLETS